MRKRRLFESLEPRRVLDSTIVFNEIMYNPGGDQELEWIELHSQMAVDMDVSNWHIDGIGYTFPAGTMIARGSHVVVAKSPAKLHDALGIDALGPYGGQLSNGGESLRLVNNSGRVMDEMDYEDQRPWPVAADGSGATLAKIDPDGASASADGWAASGTVGGTPGATNFAARAGPPCAADKPLLLSEVPPAATSPFWIELYNPRTSPVDLGGFTLQQIGSRQSSHRFASQVVAPHDFVQLDLNSLGWSPALGDRLFLFAADQTSVVDAVNVETSAQARAADHNLAWRVPSTLTPGNANQFEWESDVVINEIMYHAPGISPIAARPAIYQSTTLIALDQPARWRYRESAVGLPADWANAIYSAGVDGWLEGPAPIGFESAALDEPLRTVVKNPAIQFPYITTYYFQHEFTVGGALNDPTLELEMDYLVDDGAVFYLNGAEFHRFNMPSGPLDSSTLAAEVVGNAVKTTKVAIPRAALQPGVNRLSVEIHQAESTSNDVVFGVELRERRQVVEAIPATPRLESHEQWIELFNRNSTRTIDLTGWAISDAVRFRFPAGTQLAPGQFLIVAGDAVALRAKYPHLANIVGAFDGELSRRDEHILLTDARGNPADEVYYFDGGRWPEYADGGGSSLQLRDAWADNSKPESWWASDEAGNSRWQTISYRGVVQPDGFRPGVTNRYQEFVVGLLDAGEVLIDDISVVEDPAGVAIERIQNGSFEEDALGGQPERWRIAGNHHGQVVIDPDDSSNQVLRLRATGAMEDRLNHAETTLIDNARIRVGIEYAISLRARWQAGSNQLNTHLYFDRLQRTHSLHRPLHVGTPGRAHRSMEPNIGPTYEGLIHHPPVPDADQPVTVTVKAADPQGIADMQLWYSVDSDPWKTVAMSDTGGGVFTAQIPGQSASRVVQFYIQGIDARGALSQFPARGPSSRALYKVQDNRASDGLLHNFRIVMTQPDTALLHGRTNVTSDGRLGATVIYNEREVFYDVGVRLKGSNAGRSDATYLGFNVRFDPMHLFRGVHESVAIDRSGRSSLTPRAQDEILIKHIANHAGGIPSMYDDLVHVIAPDPRHSRTALLMMARYGDVFLDSQYERGSEGTVFKMDIAYVPNATTDRDPESPKVPFPYSHPLPARDLQDLGDDKEAYRAHLLIQNNRADDDYSQIIQAAKALSLRGDQWEEVVDRVIDVDQWARVFALQSLVGAADVYTRSELHHNISFYVRPSDNRVLALPWDWDFAFTAPSSQSLIGSSGAAGRLLTRPSVRRLVYGHLLDMLNTTFHAEYLDRWIDHYGEVAGQNLSPIKSYVRARERHVRSRLPEPVAFEITRSTPEPLAVDEPIVTLEGQGWIDVHEIRLLGHANPLNLRWLDDETWQVKVSVPQGDQTITLEAIDRHGNLVGVDQIAVRSSAINPISQSLRITEVNYDPPSPSPTERARNGSLESSDFEFIELQNVGDRPIHLLDVRLDGGVEYAFPDAVLEPNEFALVVARENAFRIRYGSNARVIGEFSGRLNNSGERLQLRSSDGDTILELQYAPDTPWPPAAAGAGATLELVDPAVPLDQYPLADHWRASAHAGGSPGSLSDPAQLDAGDLSGDGQISARDVDLLCAAIQWGQFTFDLNLDDRLDEDDVTYLVESLLGTRRGDANLDGVFNSSDLVAIFQQGEYEDGVAGNSTWADGDWNCDGEFDTSDLVSAFQAGGFMRAASAAKMATLTSIRPTPTADFLQTEPGR